MSVAFLVFASVWLAARLVCHFRDDGTTGRMWRLKTGVELGTLLLLYRFGGAGIGAGLTVVVLNGLGFRLERRSRRKDLARLALGIIGLLAWSVWFSPALGLEFRPEVRRVGDGLGHWSVLGPLVQALSHPGLWLTLFGFLLCANESNLVIRAVFDWLDLKPRTQVSGGVLDAGEFNRGRVIGILERGLLYGFVLNAQYGAIGFILAAKAFTRFKALDDRPFAEYVLIGTLLSACLAFLIGGAVRWLGLP